MDIYRSSFKPTAKPTSADVTPSWARLVLPHGFSSFLRSPRQRPGYQLPPREVPSTQPCYRTGESCLLLALSMSGPGKQAARRAQGRIPPAQPSPSPAGCTHRRGSDRRSATVLERKPAAEGPAVLGAAILLPPAWPAAPGQQRSPAQGWRDGWPRAGQPGLSEAWEARERWQWACWSWASPDWKLQPADGCLAAGTKRGAEAFQRAEAGRVGWGHPQLGRGELSHTGKVLLHTHTAGDSLTAQPFPVPPDPPELSGHPACAPQTLRPWTEAVRSRSPTPGQTGSE